MSIFFLVLSEIVSKKDIQKKLSTTDYGTHLKKVKIIKNPKQKAPSNNSGLGENDLEQDPEQVPKQDPEQANANAPN